MSLEQAKSSFETYIINYMLVRGGQSMDVRVLTESMDYSLRNGGKRFRPLLCLSVGEALGLVQDELLPMAAAIEFVHTYSLIHDDLPCMDDDTERRGQPTNHIKYDQATALLAGDSLLTESFAIVASHYKDKTADLVMALSRAAGWSGMIRGQILDLGKGKSLKNIDDLINLHKLKTGQLIAFCFEAPAILAGKESKDYFDLGLKLGLAFQIKDDILDADEDGEMSFTSFLGLTETQEYLDQLTAEIQNEKSRLGLNNQAIDQLISFNLNRNL